MIAVHSANRREYFEVMAAAGHIGSLGQAAPLRALPGPVEDDIKVIRRDRLGGLIHEYSQVA